MEAQGGVSEPSWPAVLAMYGGGLIIGATLDSFSASSAYLIALHGFTDRQYGSIYIPQLIAAAAGAIAGGVASRLFSLRRLFEMSMVAFLAAQTLLILGGWPGNVLTLREALLVLMGATASFGFGFGFGGGPLNGLVALQFPGSRTTAITALHMCAGAGLAVAPFVFSRFALAGHWTRGIICLVLLTALVLALAILARLPDSIRSGSTRPSPVSPVHDKVFWILVIAAIAYALVEGTFSNWVVLFVQGDLRLPAATAAAALSTFWGGLTVGRLCVSVLALRIKPLVILCALCLCMMAALLLVRSITSPASALVGFAVAGLACSAFFPLLVGFSAEDCPDQVSWLASMLTAALMTGVGLGSYAIGALRASVSIRDLYAYAMAYPILALAAVLVAQAMRRARITKPFQ